MSEWQLAIHGRPVLDFDITTLNTTIEYSSIDVDRLVFLIISQEKDRKSNVLSRINTRIVIGRIHWIEKTNYP